VKKERLAKFGLELSEDKSKIIKFGRYAGDDAGSFDFLGFTIISGKSRSGKFTVKYRTSEKKLKAKRVKIKKWIRQNMHIPLGELIKKLNVKLRGHYNYYGLSHNYKKMNGFRRFVERTLFKALNRRGGKKKMNWNKFSRIMEFTPILEPTITVPLW
jgi:hypothetical protein